jgi:hypothetical protein
MRKHPIIVVAVLVGLLAYAMLRELGHLAALWALKLPAATTLRYRFLPAVDISPDASATPSSAGWVIAAGPIAAIAAGYVLLAAITRWKPGTPSFVRVAAAATCYLGLMLDPIYYAAIPFFSLGGEPELVAKLLGVPLVRLQISALILLVLNVILARRWVVPLLRPGQRNAGT